MNYWIIILGIVIFILIYILFAYFYKTPALITKAEMKSKIPQIDNKKILSPTSKSYTYSMWLAVNNLPKNNESNCVFYFSAAGIPFIVLYFEDDKPRLKMDMNEGSVTNDRFVSSATKMNDQLITDNFPLQSWVYITISVDSGNIVDCYINGKLVKSFYANTTLEITNSPNINFGTIDASIAGFSRVPNATDPQTVWNNYLNGSGISNTSSYGLNLALTQNTVPQNTWVIF